MNELKKDWAYILLLISASILLAFCFAIKYAILNSYLMNYGNIKEAMGETTLFTFSRTILLDLGLIIIPLLFVAALLIKKFPIACLFTALVCLLLIVTNITVSVRAVKISSNSKYYNNLLPITVFIPAIIASFLGLVSSAKIAYDEFLGG